MPLMSFSEPVHIPLLLSGAKKQTTRRPRKIPLKVGHVLNCYYKPRQKPDCKNCINFECLFYEHISDPDYVSRPCTDWKNYFGQAVITKIIRAHYGIDDGVDIHEFRMSAWPRVWLDEWSIADGFESFEKADEWFDAKMSKTYCSHWTELDWDIITFEPRWVA